MNYSPFDLILFGLIIITINVAAYRCSSLEKHIKKLEKFVKGFGQLVKVPDHVKDTPSQPPKRS